MKFNDIYTSEPMKYYAPTAANRIDLDVLSNPKNYIDYIATTKYDGEWCRVIVDEDHNVKIQSRTISKVTGEYGDKTELVPHLVEVLKNLPKNTVLLGELCFEDITKTSKDVGTILRCKAPKAIERQIKTPLVLKVFDCLFYHNMSLMETQYNERLNYSTKAVTELNNELVKHTEVFSDMLNINEIVTNIWSKGGEGVVLVRKDMLYQPGKRPARQSIKLKKSLGEFEVKVIGTLEPKVAYAGQEIETWEYWINPDNNSRYTKRNYYKESIEEEAGMFYAAVTKPFYYGWKNGITIDCNGTAVDVSSGLTDADREWLATSDAQTKIANGELYAVITGMEIQSDSGSIRHPSLMRLRTDM